MLDIAWEEAGEEFRFGELEDDVYDSYGVGNWREWTQLDPFRIRRSFNPYRYLALLFHVWPAQLQAIVESGIDESYDMRLIRKRSGDFRILMIPDPRLRWLQRRMLRNLLSGLPVHRACHGFVRDRKMLTAVEAHRHSRYLLSLDLKDAFSSVTRKWLLEELLEQEVGAVKIGKWLALAITRLCTTLVPGLGLEPRLPQGAPSSPVLFNFVCRDLDRRLAIFADKMGAIYTRYADNIAISADGPITELEVRTLCRIVNEKTPFELNERKTKLMEISGHTNLQVLGVSIRDGELRLPKRTRRRLRGALHTALTKGDVARAAGLLSLPRQIYGEDLPRQIIGKLGEGETIEKQLETIYPEGHQLRLWES
ncbi:MAG: reverse transcriptase family protein [bacterium]|nr:reverse transcriptase family protein [bacterium]